MDLIEMIICVALCFVFYALGAYRGNEIAKEYEKITDSAFDVIKKQQEMINEMLEDRKTFFVSELEVITDEQECE